MQFSDPNQYNKKLQKHGVFCPIMEEPDREELLNPLIVPIRSYGKDIPEKLSTS